MTCTCILAEARSLHTQDVPIARRTRRPTIKVARGNRESWRIGSRWSGSRRLLLPGPDFAASALAKPRGMFVGRIESDTRSAELVRRFVRPPRIALLPLASGDVRWANRVGYKERRARATVRSTPSAIDSSRINESTSPAAAASPAPSELTGTMPSAALWCLTPLESARYQPLLPAVTRRTLVFSHARTLERASFPSTSSEMDPQRRAAIRSWSNSAWFIDAARIPWLRTEDSLSAFASEVAKPTKLVPRSLQISAMPSIMRLERLQSNTTQSNFRTTDSRRSESSRDSPTLIEEMADSTRPPAMWPT